MAPPQIPAGMEPLDERTHRHLRGACCNEMGWVLCWLGTYLMIIYTLTSNLDAHGKKHVVFAVFCSVLTGVIIPTSAWFCLGRSRKVAFGLLVDFFWWGGLGGTTFAGIMNTNMIQIFHGISPGCAIVQRNPSSGNDSFMCQLWQMVQWTLTPGLWEELYKAVWVLIRIKTKPWWTSTVPPTEPVPTMTCGCFPTKVCTFYWRLAGTPEAVFLCALASGAGFESIENVQYMINPIRKLIINDLPDQYVQMQTRNNFVRSLFFVHIVWTGYVGLRAAQYFFAEPAHKPSPLMIMLPPMVIHGLWDWIAFDGGNGNPAYLPAGWQMPLLMVLVVVSTCLCIVPIAGFRALRTNVRASVVQSELELQEARPAENVQPEA